MQNARSDVLGEYNPGRVNMQCSFAQNPTASNMTGFVVSLAKQKAFMVSMYRRLCQMT